MRYSNNNNSSNNLYKHRESFLMVEVVSVRVILLKPGKHVLADEVSAVENKLPGVKG